MLHTLRWAAVYLLMTALACTVLSWIEQPAQGPRKSEMLPGQGTDVPRPDHAPTLRGRAIRQTERAERSVRREELSPEEEPCSASFPEGREAHLVDATYELPQPPPGDVWIGAETLYDATLRRGLRRPTISWPASDLGGRSAAVIEAMKRLVAPATWEEGGGSELRARGGHAIFARTTQAVHAQIRYWLDTLSWTTIPRRLSGNHELAWMLTQGTPIEREWANEAIARMPTTSRNQVEEILAREPSPRDTGAQVAPELGIKGTPHIRLECQLIRSEPLFFRDLGIDIRGLPDYHGGLVTDPHVSYLDDTQREVLERSIARRERTERLSSRDAVSPSGARVSLALGEFAVLHLRTTVSEDRRFIQLEGRVHAQDGSRLFFAPRFHQFVHPEGSTLLICVRDVITGEPATKHTLSILLQAACIDCGVHCQPTADPPDTDWLPVQPIRDP